MTYGWVKYLHGMRQRNATMHLRQVERDEWVKGLKKENMRMAYAFERDNVHVHYEIQQTDYSPGLWFGNVSAEEMQRLEKLNKRLQ